jgi:hypothetical protein
MPMPPGCSWPPPPTPSPAPSGCSPHPDTPWPAATPSAPNSSTSPLAPPAPDVTPSPGTYRVIGPGNTSGSTLFTPPTVDHQRWPPKRKPRSVIAAPVTNRPTRARPNHRRQAGNRGQQLTHARIQTSRRISSSQFGRWIQAKTRMSPRMVSPI